MDAATIERQALALTTAERAMLADHLLQTLDLEDSDRLEFLAAEAENRLQAYERGEIGAVDGPGAVAALRRKLS